MTAKHTQMLKDAWGAYHPAYMEFFLKERPDFYQFYANGGVSLEPSDPELVGDVDGLRLLDTSCGGDAEQAFSWANLGADVVGSDLSPVAIDIARKNAAQIGADVEFIVADAQTLEPFADTSFDIVYSTYICWFEDLFLACRNWYRVLKPGGRLLLTTGHPLTSCMHEVDGQLQIYEDEEYLHPSPIYYVFDGTPLARRHGGYQNDKRIVSFLHPISEVVNAIVDAGFTIGKMLEQRESSDTEEGPMSSLPNQMSILAHKGEL